MPLRSIENLVVPQDSHFPEGSLWITYWVLKHQSSLQTLLLLHRASQLLLCSNSPTFVQTNQYGKIYLSYGCLVNLESKQGKLGAVVRSDRSKMATVEPETTPTPNPPSTEEEKTESNQEVANPQHYIKHPLQNSLYNHIQLSSNLMPGCDYSLFKDGIEPMWEDEKNKRGGRWLITLNKQQRRSDLDRFWLETLLCLIGESFDDYSDDVCGAVVNVRAKGDKIAIWTTECENREAVTHIGRVYKERLGLPPKIVIGYQSHADTATKSGSTTKNSHKIALTVSAITSDNYVQK
ncbi:Eukaryotic Translation Initiation Factor 4E [Manis pentadactyla]|nr:Eukaryotic Translation Initiation Factor 4E [Manis pentadactyla]